MLTVLVLTGIEKLINFTLKTDEITQAGLKPLAGKVMRLNMRSPSFSIDIFFNDTHIRLEPVSLFGDSVFEAKADPKTHSNNFTQTNASTTQAHPDCIITVANVAELLNLMRSPKGNLPIEGDYKVLMQFKQLIAGFDPDIAGQLEPLIGVSLASQLGILINQLKANFASTAKHTFNDVADWVDDVAGNAIDPNEEAEVNSLKQQLLKLRADIQREEARLAMIKAEQAKLRQQ